MRGLVRANGKIQPGDAGTLGVTVPWVRKLIQEGARDPAVRAHAQAIVAGEPDKHPAVAISDYLRDQHTYVRDEVLAPEYGADADTHEILHGAPLQVATELEGGPASVRGDCDDRTIMLNSLLESIGFKTNLVLVKGRTRNDYSHIYSEVVLPGVGGVPLDTIMDGKEGRPLLQAGREIGPPHARDRLVVPSIPQPFNWTGALALAAAVWWMTKRR